ncbi:MAG: MATE family efflux transporter [Oscillospiraceae bacterium]|nr:MATE family efflux transporter [Oscillospiraceae bacterium]
MQVRNKLIGDRPFYRRVAAVAVPIIVQNGITTFVSLLDNVMVGRVGTLEMSGVSVVNQILLIFMLSVWGINAGAGIFTAQFRGSCDNDGIRYTLRYKLLACMVITAAFIVAMFPAAKPLIGLFLQGEGSPEDARAIMGFGLEYLDIMLWGLVPFALCNAYAGTLRECDKGAVPMVGSMVAVGVNLVLNYLLIFGKLGLPAMGVRGAALATVISRFVELGVVAGWAHLHTKVLPCIKGLFRSVYIPGKLLGKMILKSTPLLFNEALYATGMGIISQCYSTCGLAVVSAVSIATTLNNLASVVTTAIGNTIGIIMGQMLGANHSREELRTTNSRLLALAVAAGVTFGLLLVAISWVFPLCYNASGEIRALATSLILIMAVVKPFLTFSSSCYYTVRAGGQIGITFLYDSGFMFVFTIPIAFCLSRFTDISILPMFFCCQLPDVCKCVLGFIMIKKERWMQRLIP